MESIITFRALERILAIIIGGVCVYLGYRLFLRIPEQKEGEATIKFPGDLSVYIARVGPGVFFALFGAAIVAVSLYQGVIYLHQTPIGASPVEAAPGADSVPARPGIEFFGGFNPPRSHNDFELIDRDRLSLSLEMESLNAISGLLSRQLSEQRRAALQTRITSIKLRLMQTVWGPDWGDFSTFQLWVEAGAHDPIPEHFQASATYFRAGQGHLP